MYIPYGYNPYVPPIYGPPNQSSGGMTIEDVERGLASLKRIKKDMKDEEEKAKNKKPSSTKGGRIPVFTFTQMLALMTIFGPLVGYVYLYSLYHMIEKMSNLVK